MGSDRARISYDEHRQYRAVVMQQGRVTVEADWNEAWQIADEEVRTQVLDIVGPSGTPDDGYLVGPAAASREPFDFSVGNGTMYVGGLRAYLPTGPILYSNQAEWLNRAYDGDWIDSLKPPTKNEFVYLFLQEQEVSAVEDTALLEVALGGPDTAQRVRLVQHIKRLPTSARDCIAALTDAIQHWQTEGFTFDPATMRLLPTPTGTLKASFQQSSGIANPCEPQSTGGYLGADNQLIRVQITGYDKENNRYSLVWGFDNASFIYRVKIDSDEQTITLQSKPIDDFHMLTKDQVVELLPKAAQLASSDTTDYIAAATGLIVNFDVVDPQHIKLTSALPTTPINYSSLSRDDVVFLRVWQGQTTSIVPGTPVTLGTTGLQVTIETTNTVRLPIGAYWSIAVRPTTPTNVYPARYFTPQVPDGPRIWVCPLAVIAWDRRVKFPPVGIGQEERAEFQLLADCRHHFANLTDQGGGCCDEIVRSPRTSAQGTSTQSDLHSIINRHTGRTDQQSVTICLKPGTYELSSPLLIQQSNLVLEGCGEPVVIQCAAGSEKNFQDGLVILNQANNITFNGITFKPPATQFSQGQQPTIAGMNITALQQLTTADFQKALEEELFVSIGIRVLSCHQLTIKNCIFQFPPTTTFCAGIFANGTCQGFVVQENQFIAAPTASSTVGQLGNNLFGCLFASTTILSDKTAQDDIKAVNAIKHTRESLLSANEVIAKGGGSVLTASLQDAFFLDNHFTGLAAAALIDASIGAITIERNIVQQCSAGFYLLSSRTLALTSFMDIVDASKQAGLAVVALFRRIEHTQQTPLMQFASVLTRGYPLPLVFDTSQATKFTSDDSASLKKALDTISTWLDSLATLFSQEPPTFLPPPQTTPLTTDFHTLHILLSITGSLVFSRAANQNTPKLALQISDNTIDAFLFNSQSTTASHTALLVWDDLLSTESSITMGTNTLRNVSVEPTAFLLKPVFCTITGNFFLNTNEAVPSDNLVLIPGVVASVAPIPIPIPAPAPVRVGVAVTGNVFQGQAILPARILEKLGTVPSPMNTWAFLNTEI